MEEAIVEVGAFGRYQKIITLLMMIPATLPCSFIAFNQVFVSASPDHWCRVPELMELGLPLDLRKNLSIPQTRTADGILKYSQCEMYAVNYSELASRVLPLEDAHKIVTVDKWPVQKCVHGWEYDHTYYDATLVTKFHLVCDQDWWPSFNTSMFYSGSLLGTIIFGWMTDRYGRKNTFFVVLFLAIVLPTASAFSANYATFTVLRFLIGFIYPAIYQIPLILSIEITSAKYHTAFGMILGAMYGASMSILCGVAAIFRHWFPLTLISSTPFVILFGYWWIIPESPRWLVGQNRFQEAEELLQKIAKVNKKNVEMDILRKLNENYSHTQGKPETNPFILFSRPNMSKKTLLIIYIWLTNSIVYVGLSYMSVNLSANDYWAFAISGLVEAPACLFGWYAMEKWGRRWTTFLTMIGAGVCCASIIFVAEDNVWLNVILPSIGKFGITGTFSVVYVFGCELLPTVVRGNGLAVCSFICGLGLIGTPYIVYLVVYNRMLPLLIMSFLSITGGLAAIYLPETFKTSLPQTLEDGENFGKHMKIFPF